VIPETRYAKTTDDVHIAYQVLGDGPTDLVFVPGFVFNVEQLWAWPQAAKCARRLAEFSRLVVFDRRGTGLSDHIVQSDRQLTLEARMDDIRAVMDAAGSDRATLLSFEMAFAVAAMFAATYPDRTDALIAFGAAAAWRWAPDHPWEWSGEQWDTYLADIDTGWGTLEFAEREGRSVWPDIDDPQWFSHYAMFMRRSVGPGDAAALLRVDSETDARGILSAIRVPTLVLHRKGDRSEPVDGARYIADHIPGATLIELPGNNHGWMSPDQEEALEEIERFVLQLRREEAEIDRVLATVMFTDIVGSTARAAELGSARWKELLLRHHKVIRGLLLRYRGTEIDAAGDGFFATFDGPARAIRCALAVSRAVRISGSRSASACIPANAT